MRQYNMGYGLDQQKLAEQIRQYNMGYGLDAQKLAEQMRQYDLGYGLDTRKLDMNQSQFEAQMNQNQSQWEAEHALDQAQFDFQVRKYEEELAKQAQSGSGNDKKKQQADVSGTMDNLVATVGNVWNGVTSLGAGVLSALQNFGKSVKDKADAANSVDAVTGAAPIERQTGISISDIGPITIEDIKRERGIK